MKSAPKRTKNPWPTPRTLSKGEWPPNYVDVYRWRQDQFLRLRTDPYLIAGAKEYYRTHKVDFINHWCDTYDPRNAGTDVPTRLPFVLFERQAQFFDFVDGCARDQENGLVDKSRTMGVTWLCCADAVHTWLFSPGASVGFGSRKVELVDKLGDPDTIFEKMRILIRGLPRLFWPAGFSIEEHATFMRMINPENEATITGEGGDNIGRGGRKSKYYVDEAAHLEHAESVEASLSETTRVRIDVSTTAGVGTIYDRKRDAGREWAPGVEFQKGQIRVFVADWRDHPDMTEEWHARREREWADKGLIHVFRQEVDRDPRSAQQGILIRSEWIRSAIDAHVKLGFGDDGPWSAALDVADEGGDLNALTLRKGVVLRAADDWGEGDTGKTARRAANSCANRGPIAIQYDCVGVGSGVKAEANRLKEDGLLPRGIVFVPWNAGGAVLHPDQRLIPGDRLSPLVKDFFANLKAQGYWSLARRFEKTHRAVTEGLKYDAEELISIDSKIVNLRQVERELSQPTVNKDNAKMKLSIDKKPDGARSPNLSDSIMMNYFPMKGPVVISDAVLERAAQR